MKKQFAIIGLGRFGASIGEELMKMGHIHVEQDGLFDDISVEVQTDPDTWKNLTEFAEDEQ